MATGRKITLKNDNDEWLIPKTTASNVVALIGKDDEGNTSFVYQDSVNSTLAQAKMDKGETGKDADGKPIYFNKTGKDLDDSIQKVINGDTPVAKADVAQYLCYDNPDEGKEDKIDYEGLMGKVDTKATEAISKVTDEIYATVDNKIDDVETKSIQLATTGKDKEGRVRLATESDMLNEQIVDDEGYYGTMPNAVAVTPYVLKRYLFGGDYISGVVGAANGVASLDEYGKLPSSQMPDGIDAIIEYDTYDDFPARGEGGKIYVDLSTGKSYRWGGTTYVEISKSLALGETTGTAYEGSKGKANADAISNIFNGTTAVPKAVSAKTTKVSKSSEADPNFALSFYAGQAETSTTPTADKVYVGSRVDPNIISVPKLDGSASMANYMNLRMSFTSRYFHEISVLPNYEGIYHRMVYDGNALEWKQLAYKSDVDEVRQDVKNIEIGGVNLILNSDFSQGTTYWNPLNNSSTTIFNVEENIASFTLGISDAAFLQTSAILFEVGQKYTISFDCRSDEYTVLDYCYFIGQEGQGNKSIYIYGIKSEWKRIIYTFTSEISGLYRFGFGANRNRNTAGSFQLRNVKIEKGNKATDWSPSLHDEVAWRKIVGLNYVVTEEFDY